MRQAQPSAWGACRIMSRLSPEALKDLKRNASDEPLRKCAKIFLTKQRAVFRRVVALRGMKTFYFAKRKLQFLPAATILVAVAMSITLSAQTITTFDAPGGGMGAGQGTYATNINPSGAIIGFSGDANNVRHGFIRSQDGSFTIFDAPGAGTAAFQGTRAYATNPSGTITGFFSDAGNVFHGYVRSNQGVITVFDAPGAGTGPFQGPNAYSIAPNGAVTGFYFDPNNVVHGFVREADGALGLSKF